MLRRRNTTLLKIIIGIAIVYFGSLLLCYQGFLNFSEFKSFLVEASQRDARGRPSGSLEGNTDFSAGKQAAIDDVQQPVIHRPNIDRLEFEEKIHRDAESEQRRRQRLEEEEKSLEEVRHQHEIDRKRVPFGNVMQLMENNNPPLSNSVTQPMNEKQLAIEKIQPLIDAGLVVVKWNGDKENPAVPGGPGMIIIT